MKQANKVAIVGCYFSGNDAPWDDESFDMWTLNHGFRMYKDKRITVWFDLHDWDAANYQPQYLEDLPDKPKFKVIDTWGYPYKEIMARYGYNWENSIPLMMAYAGYLDYRSIYLFGLESVEFTDTPAMAANLYRVMGALRAEGRKVYICNDAAMDHGTVYGLHGLQKTALPGGFSFKHKG